MTFQRFLNQTPIAHDLPHFDPGPETDWFGIKALWYEGPQYRDKRTKVFAYIGYPNVKTGEKVPAVVLVHGGGGHAYPEWIRRWNEKGFAAIAMETTGYIPSEDWKGHVGTEEHVDGQYVHELYGELSETGYDLGPDNTEMHDFALPVENQWMYHAVADTILAHNLLLQDPKVDAAHIGIVGISWGGVIAAIAIGYDTRYAFAVPIYGSGYIDCYPSPKRIPSAFREPTVQKQWSASNRFDRVKIPVLWQCWRPDTCFSIKGNSLSYQATRASGSFLSISPDMHHSHWHGWHSNESYRFAQAVSIGRLPLIQQLTDFSGQSSFRFQIAIPEDFSGVSVRVVYSTTPLEYDSNDQMTNEWRYLDAELYGDMVFGSVPQEAACCYVEMRGYANNELLISSTALLHRSDGGVNAAKS